LPERINRKPKTENQKSLCQNRKSRQARDLTAFTFNKFKFSSFHQINDPTIRRRKHHRINNARRARLVSLLKLKFC
jgi:hypothetical protein